MVNRRQLLRFTAIGTATFAAPSAYPSSEKTMAFNTGNNVPSTDPRDLYDNATNLDKFSNGQELEYEDRLGVPRKSLAGIRQDVQDAMSRLGYQIKGNYAAGLLIENYGEVFRKDGEFYRAKASLTLPYSLNGNWAVDGPLFVSVGDAVLRQALAETAGAALVGFSDSEEFPEGTAGNAIQQRARMVYSVADLSSLSPSVGAAQLISSGRSGLFIYQVGDFSSQVAADPQSGVYVAPSSDSTGAGGAWVRGYSGPFHADWIGNDLSSIPAFVTGDVVLSGSSYSGAASVVNRTDLRFVTAGRSKVNGLPIYTSRFTGVIERPAGFPWQPPLYVVERKGEYEAIIDLSVYEKASKASGVLTYYVDVTRGDNSTASGHDGLSPDKAYRSIYWAIRQAGVAGASDCVIRLAAGVYDRNNGWQAEKFAGNLTVICEPGTYITTAEPFASLTWTSQGGGVYSAPRTSVSRYHGVIDMSALDSYGKPTAYAPMQSSAEVAAEPGSYYFDSATNTVYVRAYNDRAPDKHILVLLSVTNGAQASGANNLFVRGGVFMGGSDGAFKTGVGATAKAVFDGVEFTASSSNNGLTSAGTGLTISVNCQAYRNWSDGFNYHDTQAVGAKAVEINCKAWLNGLNKPSTEAENSNGSTAHEDVTVVRVNTVSWYNKGPNIVDINDVHCWNIGCKAWDSTAQASAQKVDFYFTDSNVTAWLDGCEGGLTGKQLDTNATSTAYVRGWRGGLSAAGNIQAY